MSRRIQAAQCREISRNDLGNRRETNMRKWVSYKGFTLWSTAQLEAKD